MTNDPTREHIRRIAGEAGHVSYYVDVPTACGTRHFAFSGNIFVGPVLVTIRDERGQWRHHVVEEPRRFGEFVSEDWIHEYLQWWRREHLLDTTGSPAV